MRGNLHEEDEEVGGKEDLTAFGPLQFSCGMKEVFRG